MYPEYRFSFNQDPFFMEYLFRSIRGEVQAVGQFPGMVVRWMMPDRTVPAVIYPSMQFEVEFKPIPYISGLIKQVETPVHVLVNLESNTVPDLRSDAFLFKLCVEAAKSFSSTPEEFRAKAYGAMIPAIDGIRFRFGLEYPAKVVHGMSALYVSNLYDSIWSNLEKRGYYPQIETFYYALVMEFFFYIAEVKAPTLFHYNKE